MDCVQLLHQEEAGYLIMVRGYLLHSLLSMKLATSIKEMTVRRIKDTQGIGY